MQSNLMAIKNLKTAGQKWEWIKKKYGMYTTIDCDTIMMDITYWKKDPNKSIVESRVTVIPVINLATAQWTAEAVRARAIIRVQANTADPAAEAVDREAAEDEVTAAAVDC